MVGANLVFAPIKVSQCTSIVRANLVFAYSAIIAIIAHHGGRTLCSPQPLFVWHIHRTGEPRVRPQRHHCHHCTSIARIARIARIACIAMIAASPASNPACAFGRAFSVAAAYGCAGLSTG